MVKNALSSMKITQTERVTVAGKQRFPMHYDMKLTFEHRYEHQPLWLVCRMPDPCSPHDSFHPVHCPCYLEDRTKRQASQAAAWGSNS